MKQAAIYGICGGLLLASMQLVEYRLLVVDRSLALYGLLVAAAFAATGVILGLNARRHHVIVKEVPVEVVVQAPAPFTIDQTRIDALGITPRELEVLRLIADGLSTREMAERLFVSENTVKTHISRVMDKLGASRRTQAVQIAQRQRIIA